MKNLRIQKCGNGEWSIVRFAYRQTFSYSRSSTHIYGPPVHIPSTLQMMEISNHIRRNTRIWSTFFGLQALAGSFFFLFTFAEGIKYSRLFIIGRYTFCIEYDMIYIHAAGICIIPIKEAVIDVQSCSSRKSWCNRVILLVKVRFPMM